MSSLPEDIRVGTPETEPEASSSVENNFITPVIEDSEDQENHTTQIAILSAHFGRAPYPSDDVEDEVEAEVCKEWEKGNCHKGEKCRFRHQKGARKKKRSSMAFNASWLNSLAAKVHEEDESRRNQPTLNTDEEEAEPTKSPAKDLVVEVRDTNLEKMFQELGRKRRDEQAEQVSIEGPPVVVDVPPQFNEDSGDDDWDLLDSDKVARSQHDSSTEAVNIVSQEDLERRNREEAVAIDQYIVLQSSMVTCGAGLEIRQVVAGYDLRQIAIKNLPTDATKIDIETILVSLDGISKLDFCILNLKSAGRTLQAVVIADKAKSRTIVSALNGSNLRKRPLTFEILANATWTTGSMEVNQPSLTLSWSIPEAGARGMAIYKFDQDIAGLYERLYESEGVQMDTSYLVTPDTGAPTGQVTLTVDFDNWDNLQTTVRNIEAKRPPNVPHLRCSHPTPHQYSLQIPVLQHRAQLKQWMALADTKNKKAAKLEFTSASQSVTIHVLGDDRQATGALKVRVEKLAGGEVFDGPYWHPTFASEEEDTNIFFNKVRTTSGVELVRDTPIRAVRLYGDPKTIEQAQQMIRDEADKRAQVMSRTALSDTTADFFVRGGKQRLEELVGEANMELSITAKWSVIKLRGGDEATHHLERLLEESRVDNSDDSEDTGVDAVDTCPICFNDVFAPERLACGHGYCAGCLQDFLAAATNNKTFPVMCMGNDATCGVAIALPFLRRFLPHQPFKQLIEAAFANYLERNPQEFRYCPTPDCRQTYRKQAEAQAETIKCPSCFVAFCSACEKDHPRMTCREYRLSRDEAEQDRLNGQLAQANGYRRCPRCAVWIEKVSGCNHMTCKCGAHVCWVCLGVFAVGEIYTHLRSAHGGTN